MKPRKYKAPKELIGIRNGYINGRFFIDGKECSIDTNKG